MFIFDIETKALPLDRHPIAPESVTSGLLPEMPEFTAPANWKDPEKIAADILGKREKWLKEEQAKLARAEADWMDGAAISPDLATVEAIGCHTGKARMDFTADSDEQRVLSSFWTSYREALELAHPIIGFNHLPFDLPFLYWRSIQHGIGHEIPKLGVWRGQLQFPGDHYDLCAIAGQRPFKGARKDVNYDKLNTVAICLGLKPKPKVSGQFFAMWPRDEQEEYLLHDIELTKDIAGILLPWLGIKAA